MSRGISGNGKSLSKLEDWQQGDFALDCGEMLYRCTPASLDAEDSTCCAQKDSAPLGFAVISQTCDIVCPAKTIEHVTVCPLVSVDENRLADVRGGRTPRYGILNTEDEKTVVDFSRTMSITKDLLMTWERSRGCCSEKQKRGFARAIETFYGRYAFPDDFTDMMRPFRKEVQKALKKGDENLTKMMLNSISELRVTANGRWDGSVPLKISFYGILDGSRDTSSMSRHEVKEELCQILDSIEWGERYSLGRVEVLELSDISAANYIKSHPVDVNYLSYRESD